MFSVKPRKRFFVGGFLFFVVLFSSFALASDVAYVYKNSKKIDQNVLDFFSAKGLSYDLINEKNLPSDFSGYDFVFLGNERFSKINKISKLDVPFVLMNKYYGWDFGLTDKNGISKVGSSRPLEIFVDGSGVDVYFVDSPVRKISIPYYFIYEKRKVDEVVSVATTERKSLNDASVVSYLAGTDNSKVGENVCFFGIIESDYWTSDAEELFGNCIDFVGGSAVAECSLASDCGMDGFVGENYCSEGNVYRTYRSYSCVSGDCSYGEDEQLVQTCVDGCESGACVGGSVSEIHDVSLIDFSTSVGGIKIKNSDGEDVLENDSLNCGEKYKFIIKVSNNGNFSEDVSFVGSVGSLDFEHNGIEGLEAGKTSGEKSKTVNVSLDEGSYEISVEALLGVSDFSPLDNFAKRNIYVSCGSSSVSGCSVASDCGSDGFVGEDYCSEGNVVKDYRTYSCSEGECSFSDEASLVESCSSGCENGVCSSGSVGELHNVGFVNVTNTVGVLRIKDSEGNDVLEGESLSCTGKYKFIFRVENFGDYVEDVSFVGTFGNEDLGYSDMTGLGSGKKKEKSKTKTLDLTSGTYDFDIVASINGDVDLSDNVIHRTLVVSC